MTAVDWLMGHWAIDISASWQHGGNLCWPINAIMLCDSMSDSRHSWSINSTFRRWFPAERIAQWQCTGFVRWKAASYYSFIDPERMKGRVGLVGWPIADGLAYPNKCSPISCKSSAGQGKFASKRPAFYHCATQPCLICLRAAPRVHCLIARFVIGLQ